ncbi:MAG: AAA-like domain-containing protein [Cyanobacteriota bacterium]
MRLFISYKRGAQPDESLALELYQHFRSSQEVFIDQTMAVGTLWAQRIDEELRRSDVLVLLLSGQSVMSEMVVGEMETAQRLQKEHGKPRILPVRVAYHDPFPYPLSAYLSPINWAYWGGPADTSRLMEELERGIHGEELTIATDAEMMALITPATSAKGVAGASREQIPAPKPLAAVARLESAEGTMDPESRFYVERDCDAIARGALERQGVTITIKGPRQMGKSSLLMRVIERAMATGRQAVYIDFQQFDQDVLSSADTFYPLFCRTISEQLELADRTEEFWADGGGNNQLSTRYLQSQVLKEISQPVLLAMDEVDRLFETEFRSDFFSMLRGWHNNRALPMARLWKRLDLALVTATEPYHLIANLNQSPFNVGEVIQLADFNLEQVADLNQRHGTPLSQAQVEGLTVRLHGHPYLVRRALYLVASGRKTMEALMAEAASDYGPFGDHLRYHLFRIVDHPSLLEGLGQVIRSGRCDDEKVCRLLVAAGLARKEGASVLPRCPLYADYFGAHVHD